MTKLGGGSQTKGKIGGFWRENRRKPQTDPRRCMSTLGLFARSKKKEEEREESASTEKDREGELPGSQKNKKAEAQGPPGYTLKE